MRFKRHVWIEIPIDARAKNYSESWFLSTNSNLLRRSTRVRKRDTHVAHAYIYARRVFTRVAHTRGLLSTREPGIKWVAKISSRLLYRLSFSSPRFPSLSQPDRHVRVSRSPLLSLSFPRVGGSKKWRTIKRNDTVKKQDVRWLRKRLASPVSTEWCTRTLVSNRTHAHWRNCTYKWYRWIYVG